MNREILCTAHCFHAVRTGCKEKSAAIREEAWAAVNFLFESGNLFGRTTALMNSIQRSANAGARAIANQLIDARATIPISPGDSVETLDPPRNAR